MRVNCNLCGGESEILPGQKMLFCSFCGSALVVPEKAVPEHLILPHERNDRLAEDALRSYLASTGRIAPRDLRVEFSYVPYVLEDDERGEPIACPCKGAPRDARPILAPPAGDYRFFDETLARREKIIPLDPEDARTQGASRILHLPLYQIFYRAGGAKMRALVMGESLYVYAEELPPSRAPLPAPPNLIAALALTIALLFIGRLGHSILARLFIIAMFAAAAWALFILRERMVRGND